MSGRFATVRLLFLLAGWMSVSAAGFGGQALAQAPPLAFAKTEDAGVALGDSTTAAVYYNLGVERLRAGDLAVAMWAAANARQLGGTRALPTLERAIDRELPGELRPLRPVGLASAWLWAARLGPPQSWAVIALTLSALAGLLGALGRRLAGGLYVSGLSLSLIGMALAAALAYTAARQQTAPRVVVAPGGTALREAPSDGAREVRRLPAGVLLDYGEALSGYLAVELPTRERGWVSAAEVYAVAAGRDLGGAGR